MLRNISKLVKGLAIARQPIGHNNLIAARVRCFSNDLTAVWPQEIKDFLATEKITQPTKIQEATLKYALQNKDLVGIARTGSGKTLAFVIPAIMKILEERKANVGLNKRPTCLVLEPTRELANQTADVFKKFRSVKIRSIVLVGGASRAFQERELRDDEFDVVIATPGRLTDLSDAGIVDLKNIKYLVLDEADRMLDMGFEPQVRRVVSKLPKERQTLMWSATWPKEIRNLANDFMTEFNHVAVDSEDLKANPNIEQRIELCQPLEKQNLLITTIETARQTNPNARFLIFCNTKRRADNLLIHLMRNRIRAITMHGDKSQQQRDHALRLFKQGHCNVMIATDVAARGLDISDITHVLNFDFPTNIEDYVHRIGRTARHEKSGIAISYLTYNDAKVINKLTDVLKSTNQKIPDGLKKLADSAREDEPTSFRPRRRYNDYY